MHIKDNVLKGVEGGESNKRNDTSVGGKISERGEGA